jgi:hypothetical protein
MAPNNQQQQAAAAATAAAVRLPDFHADSPQCWFNCLDSTFAMANITQSKFHWAMSKLPFSLTPTVRPLSRNPTAVADPYKELKELLLQSYSRSDEQRTSKWLDYPMCGSDTRPSVLWDNLTALQPATLKDAQIALFIRKLPRHISAMINMRSFDTTQEMIQRCNSLWASQTPEEAASATAAAAAAAGPWQHSSLRKANARRSPSPYRRKTPGGDKAGDKADCRRPSPTAVAPWPPGLSMHPSAASVQALGLSLRHSAASVQAPGLSLHPSAAYVQSSNPSWTRHWSGFGYKWSVPILQSQLHITSEWISGYKQDVPIPPTSDG